MQFDDPDDDEDAPVVPVQLTKNPSSNVNESLLATSSVSDPQTSAPEEVRSSNEEILRLKKLHEDMMHTVRSNVKRRRTPTVKLSSNESASTLNCGDEDAAVDTSFIEAERIDEETSGKPSHNAEIVQGRLSKIGRRRGGGVTIDAHRSNPTSKKFDGLEVVVLAAATHDLAKMMHPIDNYQLSSAVLSFSSHQHSKNQRVKYSCFVSQKKQLAARGLITAITR